MDEKYQFIHLSDIHFGLGIRGNSPLYKDIRNEVLRDCKDIANKIGPANAIIITGDIAYSGKDREYESARKWLNELCSAIECPVESIFVIPGNHDVDRDMCEPEIIALHDFLRTAALNNLEGKLTQFQKAERANIMLLEKLRAYLDFARPYSCDFHSLGKLYWTYPIPEINSKRICIVGLNSILVSDPNDSEGNLILGRSQYTTGLERGDDIEYIALLHHPLNWFRDKDDATSYLHSRARIILNGHTHDFYARCVEHENGFKQVESCSGAVTHPGGNYEYHYDWLNISIKDHDELLQLKVKVYPRVWSSTNTKFSAHNVVGGIFKEFLIDLPRPRETSVSIEPVPVTPHHIESLIESSLDNAVDTSIQTNDDPQVEKHYRRIQYLFWQKLEAAQRKQILIDLNIIPEVNDELTQTLERHALDTAKGLNKLHLLWDEVMTYLLEEQQEPNPFKETRKEG